MKRVLLNVVLPLLLLAGAALGALRLVETAETTEREERETIDPLVRVLVVTAYDGPAILQGNGIVQPAREATISPEVTGRITFQAPALVEGGRITQGQELVRVDGRSYKLAISQQRASVDRAKADLELEENASEAARREWAVSGEQPTEYARRVALRKPQVESASAGVQSARGALERAQLDLRKTTIRAPFNAAVLSENIEVGEVVAPGTILATLIGTDRFWARISLPVEELALIDFPQGDALGSKVTVTQELSSGKTVVREGAVLRLVGALDEQSRTALVLVDIERPLDPEPGELPLLSGAFVTARIEGRALSSARIVPRNAVFKGNRVWVADDDDTIHKRTLVVALSDDQRVVATSGIEVGERVIMTPMRTPTEGMQVRIDPATEAADGGR